MLLAVDVGNTQTVLGLYDGERLTDDWRVATERTKTGDELGVLLGGLLELGDVDGICLSSTVPSLVREWERVAARWAEVPILVVGPGVKTGIPIRYDDPREVGPDRIVNSIAAKHRYGAPVIVVDFGTATTFDAISPAPSAWAWAMRSMWPYMLWYRIRMLVMGGLAMVGGRSNRS